jgi:hypothetical protein
VRAAREPGISVVGPSIAEMTVDDETHKRDVKEELQGADQGGVRVFHEVRLEMDEEATESKTHDPWVAFVKGGAAEAV